jgi:hypothetical protein
MTEFDCSHPVPRSFASKRRGSDRCLSAVAAVVVVGGGGSGGGGEQTETRKEFVLGGENSGRKIKHFKTFLF